MRYVVLESAHNSELFDPLIQFVYQQNFISDIKAGKEGSFKEDFFNLMLEGRILITASLIRNFSELIEKEEREEEYQIFLSNNPVFLDPIASEVIPKQKLGVEYITDFVIKKLDNKYILVEIEKPQDKIFTNADEFSSKFTHALGQVLDFQEWIDSNGAYAKTLLPDISSPRGLLIMGRSKTMSQRQKDKLKRFNASSANIDVLTFDEVHDMAGKLLQNVIKSH